jgi:hypothetical protein
MARIFKNKTAEEVEISYSNVAVIVEASSQRDLSDTFEPWQLAASESLLVLLSQGTDKYQLNDGTKDLSLTEAVDLVRGYQQKIQLTDDGRMVSRQTVAQSGRHRMRCFTFYTADPSKLHNKKCDDTNYEDITQKEYDADGVEITSAPYTGSVKTVLDFEPAHDYEIIGGEVSVPSDLKDGTTDAWFAACIGVPDVPEQMGGNVNFVNCVNLEAFDGILDIDGRATTYMTYNATYHTNKIRFVFKHPAGVSKRFQIFLELFS